MLSSFRIGESCSKSIIGEWAYLIPKRHPGMTFCLFSNHQWCVRGHAPSGTWAFNGIILLLTVSKKDAVIIKVMRPAELAGDRTIRFTLSHDGRSLTWWRKFPQWKLS